MTTVWSLEYFNPKLHNTAVRKAVVWSLAGIELFLTMNLASLTR